MYQLHSSTRNFSNIILSDTCLKRKIWNYVRISKAVNERYTFYNGGVCIYGAIVEDLSPKGQKDITKPSIKYIQSKYWVSHIRFSVYRPKKDMWGIKYTAEESTQFRHSCCALQDVVFVLKTFCEWKIKGNVMLNKGESKKLRLELLL